MNSRFYSLSTITGTWTANKLKRAGFTESEIRQGIQRNVITENTLGVITAVRGKKSLLESELEPGSTVVKMVDGRPVEFMVVKDSNGKVSLIDPNDQSSSQEVFDRKDLMTKEDSQRQEETSSTPL